jgi:hypothetical protein
MVGHGELHRLQEEELDLLDAMDKARDSVTAAQLGMALDALHAQLRDAEWHAARASALAARRRARRQVA